MNFKSISVGLLCLMLLAACSGAPAAPIAVPTAAPTAAPTAVPVGAQQQPTATVAPTEQRNPVSSSTPPPTIEPSSSATLHPTPISITNPLLLYSTGHSLKVVYADGSGTVTINTKLALTMGRNLSAGIGSRENLVAIESGDNPMAPDREGAGPLTLNLLRVPYGNSQPLTPLFSPDMEQAIKTAAATGDRTDAIEAGIAVIENDHTLAWSPDGRYLAFIAAIDGPSSDLYSYDRDTGQINRLTDGLNQAARVFWSPDSKWIIHEEVESFGTGAGWNVKAVWAAAPDGSGNRKLYDTERSGDEVFVDWVSPNIFIVYSWTPIGLQNIRRIDLASGAAHRIGPEFPVQAYAVDSKSQAQLYVVDDYTAQQNGVTGGLYLAGADPLSALFGQVASGNWYDVRWLPHAQLFFAKGEKGVISVRLDGTTTEYFGEGALPIDAPDGAWLLAWGDGNYTSPIGLRLYTPDGELKRAITTDAVTFATWSPDSNNVFYISNGALYHAAIPNGDPQLIEENLTATEAGSVGWVMP